MLYCASHVCYTEQIKLDTVSTWKMSNDATYRAQGAKIGGVWAMPQPLSVQCVWFHLSIVHFYELLKILLSKLPCKNGFVIQLIMRNTIASLYTFIISSQYISFFVTMGRLSFRSCTAIPKVRKRFLLQFFCCCENTLMLDVLKFSKNNPLPSLPPK
jgi:hypothetical protein